MVSEKRRLQNNLNQRNAILRKKSNVEEYEKLKLKWKRKRELNKDKKKAYDKERYSRNKQNKEWVVKNNDKAKISAQKYRDRAKVNPEIDAKIKAYRRSEKGKLSVSNCIHKRRQKIQSGSISTNFLVELQRSTKTCVLCGIELNDKNRHLDHIIPLSLHGTHSEDNVRFICGKCNKSRPYKHFKTNFHLS